MEEFNHGNIEEVNLSKEMRTSFLDYSMSVIVSRALPDVRDGLKPVHRRILYAMNDLGITPDKSHKKSARIVGEVIGKYHPHGDTAVYDAMVRMAQEFSYRYPLVDGHGNFGSLDGDGAAAMRYTEARMSKISMELLRDINKDTIDWADNYDGELKEPTVLPSRFPNLIVNGAMGIAVGMATNIPPHNLKEAINATIAVIDNEEITTSELMENYIKGPDFPTGAYILGRNGIKRAYETGKGAVIMRAKVDIEDEGNHKRLIVRELPYQVNKSNLVYKIAELVKNKEIEGITALNDESNREGIRVVIDLRRDAQTEVILNQLYRLTPLQSSFGVNNVVLVDNTPMQLSMRDMLKYYAHFQEEVVRRRTEFDLSRAKERAHILEGLKIAIDHIDAIIAIIRSSKDTQTAMTALMENFGLDEIQARAILDMQLRRLTGLERDRILLELEAVLKQIAEYELILSDFSKLRELVKKELIEIRDKYGDERRTVILDQEDEVLDEELIPVENVIVSMTQSGYVKRIPVDTYKTQNRGGRGIKGMGVNEDDIIDQFISMSTHDNLLLFSNLGKVYRIRGFQIPESSRAAKGIPLVNIIPLESNETIKSLVAYSNNDEKTKYLFFVTKKGLVKRTEVTDFESIRTTGKIAITLRDGDELVDVKGTSGEDEIIIGASNGKTVRFKEDNVRPMGRNATGVIGMNVGNDNVIGMTVANAGKYILVVSENGYGKKSDLSEYNITNRGTKGVSSLKITDKNGALVALKAVNGDEDCMIMTSDGIVIRFSLDGVSTTGRATQGVRLIRVQENTTVKTVTIIDKEEESEE
jgi:DNA gyrase subunit A